MRTMTKEHLEAMKKGRELKKLNKMNEKASTSITGEASVAKGYQSTPKAVDPQSAIGKDENNTTDALKSSLETIAIADKAKVDARIDAMPKCRQNVYKIAMKGKNPTIGIKAFCQFCFGWDSNSKTEIHNCTDPACPLYPYRPYRKKK